MTGRLSRRTCAGGSQGEVEEMRYEFRGLRKDGSVFPVEVHGRRIEHGGKIGVLGTLIDNTERRRAEDELRASEARFRTFVDHATDAFFLLDEQLDVVDVNRQACETPGLEPRRADRDAPTRVRCGAGRTRPSRGSRSAPAQGKPLPSRRAIGARTARHSPSRSAPARSEQGGKLFYLALARDISERKLAEEKLREKDDALQMARTELAHVSRLTTLGELTTSIAHEVSQPLGAMVASAGACARWLAADPPAMAEARSALDNIVADGKRAREVIARIRALTKRQVPRMDLLDLNRKILEVLALTEQELRSHDIVLETRLDRTLPGVMGDRVQLQQVLLNLILNAIEAMSGVHDRPRELTIVSRRGWQQRAWWSRYAIPASGSIRTVRSESSRRSTRPKPKASASACRSAARSSRRTVGGFGRPRTSLMGRSSGSRSRLRRTDNHERDVSKNAAASAQ